MVEPYECEQRKVFTPFSRLWKNFLLAHPERKNIQEFKSLHVQYFTPSDQPQIHEIMNISYHPHWTISF